MTMFKKIDDFHEMDEIIANAIDVANNSCKNEMEVIIPTVNKNTIFNLKEYYSHMGCIFEYKLNLTNNETKIKLYW